LRRNHFFPTRAVRDTEQTARFPGILDTSFHRGFPDGLHKVISRADAEEKPSGFVCRFTTRRSTSQISNSVLIVTTLLSLLKVQHAQANFLSLCSRPIQPQISLTRTFFSLSHWGSSPYSSPVHFASVFQIRASSLCADCSLTSGPRRPGSLEPPPHSCVSGLITHVNTI
jgi:hypothetical protein